MRLFIALPLPDKIERKVGGIIDELKPLSRAVKWVNSDIIHLTVKFLGETKPDLVEPIKKALDRVAPDFKPIECSIDRLGAFPNLKRPRVFWAGLAGQKEILEKLAKHVDLEMHALGFEKENRAFKAHLTLGRVKRDDPMFDLCGAVENYKLIPESLIFSEIVLFKSTLTPRGPIYEVLHRVPLGA